ncbi:MAG: helix-turn-helix transcriptional regulator, partial [Eubacteriales bacterium]|nr:helix-turn-helix transcriptional regulator [Eubacteriales bacterium]
IIDLNRRKPAAYELELKARALMLLSVLFAHHHYTDRVAGGAPRELAGLKNALSYIYDHLSDPLSADTLSNVAQYSKYHFLRMFKRHMGLTTTAYINLMRLERSARLLRTTELSVTEVCAQCGFGNVSYFIKCFSRHYGVTPLAFRKSAT